VRDRPEIMVLRAAWRRRRGKRGLQPETNEKRRWQQKYQPVKPGHMPFSAPLFTLMLIHVRPSEFSAGLRQQQPRQRSGPKKGDDRMGVRYERRANPGSIR